MKTEAGSKHDLRRSLRQTYARAAAVAAAPGCRTVSCPAHSGLGCGSPTGFAGLLPDERVLDLGCGAGFDCLAAAVEVGRGGFVVGLDLTPDMLRLARRHVADAGATTVRLVEAAIESLPFPAASFDVVISNCVFNLCADKPRALAEAARVLKPGGRLAFADTVAVSPLPASVLSDLALYTGCVADAVSMQSLFALLHDAGFATVDIVIAEHSSALLEAWAPGADLERYIASANITARKPSGPAAN